MDGELLEKFIKGFYGYGVPEADYWFVGMEEGASDKPKELKKSIEKRITEWDKCGRTNFIDFGTFRNDIAPTWFREESTIQQTWGGLIRVLLSGLGKQIDSKTVRDYQKDAFGIDGKMCLLELSPLPCKGSGEKKWLYKKCFEHLGLEWLKTRKGFKDKCFPERIKVLEELIKKHKPKAVVFYGLTYKEHWESIAESQDVEFEKCENGEHKLFFGQNKNTQFVIMRHPAARETNGEYFIKIGKLIARKMSG